jgi:6,7-dimethyl-8-ribityllumazine synthase
MGRMADGDERHGGLERPRSRVFAGVTAGVAPVTRVAIVVSRWNERVTGGLLAGALDTLVAAGLAADAIDVAWVPGAFELPLVADRFAGTGGYAAVICLGAIIRGETEHDRHIAQAVARGIEETGRRHGVPVLFGVLTCQSLEQALARAGIAVGTRAHDGSAPPDNKGAECAAAALEMITLLDRLPGPRPGQASRTA